MHTFTLSPRDLLFLRDARPMAASDAGLGANWPRPDQLWFALLHAFHRAWPERQDWEGLAHTKHLGTPKRDGSRSLKDNPDSSDRFGALKTFGPFPYVPKETPQLKSGIYFPAPLDLDMSLVSCEGTNLPAPLTHALRATSVGKQEVRRWLSFEDYQVYLRGADISREGQDPRLYDSERNIGIAIDPETHGTVDGKLYQAEYLRLLPGVSLGFEASCDIHPKGSPDGNTVDVFGKLGLPHSLIIGGQQGVATLDLAVGLNGIRWPSAPISSRFLRWTLLSPVLFTNGWLPDWCVDSRKPAQAPLGTVMFKNAPPARLVAARIDKPLAFSGWDLKSGPKPTQLAVPAGSCYVFDCGTTENAHALAALLNPPNRRSSLFGEKGFGLGVCSSLPNPAICNPQSAI